MGTILNRYCRRCGRTVQVWSDENGLWHLTLRRDWDSPTVLIDEVFVTSQGALDAGLGDHVHGGA